MSAFIAYEDPYPHRPVPAWLFSFGVHFGALVLSSWFGPTMMRGWPQQNSPEPERDVEIVLRPREEAKVERFADGGVGGEVEDASVPESAQAIIGDPLPTAVDLPSGMVDIAPAGFAIPADTTTILPGTPPNLLNRPTVAKPGRGTGGKATDVQTKVFGVPATGSTFIYVFDRSASMAGNPLAHAKRELLASLRDLPETSSFQIIFYNDHPEAYAADDSPKLRRINGQELAAAEEFVQDIQAEGGTGHLAALRLALRLKPDAIFFLTDGNEPELLAPDLLAIQHLNQGTAINAIEFGLGPKRSKQSFLQTLAEQNGGTFGYIDVAKLPTAD